MKQLLLIMLIWLWTPLVLALPYELVEDGISGQVQGFEAQENYTVVVQAERAEIWTREPRRQQHVLSPCPEGPLEAFFQGQSLITKCASESGYKVWDPKTGQLLKEAGSGYLTPSVDSAVPQNSVLNHQGSRLVYAESRPVFKIWDLDSGQFKHSIQTTERPQLWKHNEQTLALVTKNQLQIWNLESGKLQFSLPASPSKIRDLALSTERLAISYASGLIEIRSLSGHLLKALKVSLTPASPEKALSALPIIMMPGFSQPTWRVPPLEGEDAYSHAFEQISLQGDWLAGASRDPALTGVTLRNLKIGTERRLFENEWDIAPKLTYPWLVAGDKVYHLPDGRQGKISAERILPGQQVWFDWQGQELLIRNLSDFKTRFRLLFNGNIEATAYADSRFASLDGDRILVRQLSGQQPPLSFRAGGIINQLELTSKFLISQGHDDHVMLWDLEQHRLVTDMTAPGPVSTLALSQNWLALATKETDYQNLYLYEPKLGKQRFALGGQAQSSDLLALNENQLWSFAYPKLQIWDLEARQLIRTAASDLSPQTIFRVDNTLITTDVEEDKLIFSRWAPLKQRFEAWEPDESEQRRLLGSDVRISQVSRPEEFVKGQYRDFAPDVTQARENLWWQRNGQLYLVQTLDNLLRVEKTNLSNGQRELLYTGNAAEVSVLDANEERVLLRKRNKGLIRIDWTSGKSRPWLDDYEPPVNAVTGAPQDYILNEQLFQLESKPEKQGQNAQTRISVWDLRANRLKHRFTSVDIIADIKAQFLPEHVILTGKGDYAQDQAQLQAWSLTDGKMLAQRELKTTGCDLQLTQHPALQAAWAEQISPMQVKIQICDFMGNSLAQYRFVASLKEAQQPYLWGARLYLPEADGRIQIREALTGKSIAVLDALAKKLANRPDLSLNISEKDGIVVLSAGVGYTVSLPSLVGHFVSGILDLRTGQLGIVPYEPFVMSVTDQQLSIIDRRNDNIKVIKIPRQQLAQAERFSDQLTQPVVYSFPDGLFIMNPDGRFAGYGNYQRYLHLNVDGEMLPWPEAVKRWQATGTDILSGN